jgi:hypothetical protein
MKEFVGKQGFVITLGNARGNMDLDFIRIVPCLPLESRWV